MGHILLSFLFYNVILFIVYNHYKKGHCYIKKSTLVFYTILLIAFGTYGGGEGDYLKYKKVVGLFHSLFDVTYYNGMEIQYNYLAYLLDGNYNLWRLVLFSIQFIGMSWFLYKAKLNTYPIFLCFVALCLIMSVYQRSFWGVIYFFMGVYLLIEKRNPLFLIAIALCYVSHTQNIVLIALLPLAFIDLKKWQLLIIILLLSTLATLLNTTFTSLLNAGGIEGADYVNGKMATYSESSLGNFGNSFGETMLYALRYIPMVIAMLGWLIMLFNNRKKYLSFTKPYRRVLNITIGVALSSIVVLLADLGGGTFFYRIAGMTFFPFAILLPYMQSTNSIKTKTFNSFILIFVLASELSYIKDLYYAYAHGMSF